MSTRHLPLRTALAGALAAALANLALAAPLYHVINTGVDGESHAINDAGAISGDGWDFQPGNPIWKWQDGVTTNLQYDGYAGSGDAINGAGIVAGSVWSQNFDSVQAVVWSIDGTPTYLGALPGGDGAAAYGINDAGTIVGWFNRADGSEGSFIVRDGKMKDLDPKASRSQAQAINASGQVTGTRQGPGATESHAYLFTAGKFKDLGTLGGSYSIGHALNSNGHVAGESSLATHHGTGHASRAFLWDGRKMKKLGTLPGAGNSWATGINDSEQVVGIATVPKHLPRVWVWIEGTMYDLATVLDGTSGNWQFYDIGGINNAGQIVGRATPDNGASNYVVILDPVAH
jgi:probable HAF family extracellular repeat protein